MGYTTLAKVKEQKVYRILEPLISGGDGVPEYSDVDAVIKAVSDQMDLFLGQAYSLPLSTVPSIIGTWAVQLTICGLYRYQSKTVPEEQSKIEKQILEWLQEIADGDKDLSAFGLDSNSLNVAYSEDYEEQKYNDNTLETNYCYNDPVPRDDVDEDC